MLLELILFILCLLLTISSALFLIKIKKLIKDIDDYIRTMPDEQNRKGDTNAKS